MTMIVLDLDETMRQIQEAPRPLSPSLRSHQLKTHGVRKAEKRLDPLQKLIKRVRNRIHLKTSHREGNSE
jgi:hypothetical protein